MVRILTHTATGGEGREDGRKDGDHDVADATEGFLCGFFHRLFIVSGFNL